MNEEIKFRACIDGVICDVCQGRGYKLSAYLIGHILNEVKEVCPVCGGDGIIRAPIDNRQGVIWERE